MFRLGYNTNGLAHHRPLDALDLLADLGYEACALTPDAGFLDPFHLDKDEVAAVRARAEEHGLALSIETGARYVLDPARKHFPTLMEEDAADRERRVEFLARCVELAFELDADCVSFWAGKAPGGETGDDGGHPALWDRLCEGVASLTQRTAGSGVRLAFEPEPGMFVERPAGYLHLAERLGGDAPGLCLDVGHLLCTGDLPVEQTIRSLGERLAMVHLDDIAGGVHEHRMFGEGDLDLRATLGALLEVDYAGVAAVELSRDSHLGPEAAREALGHLRTALGKG